MSIVTALFSRHDRPVKAGLNGESRSATGFSNGGIFSYLLAAVASRAPPERGSSALLGTGS